MRMYLALLTAISMSSWCDVGLMSAQDWPQFRGPNNHGVVHEQEVPESWSDTKSILWKVAMPGPGSSSPIISGDRVYVTCYSGYGDANGEKNLAALKRHLVCVDRKEGKILWNQSIESELPEDGWQGYLAEHGYASSTPVTDGERIYCFFGKTGVMAFDSAGKILWKSNVGKESSNRVWGSGASLILYGDSIIVNASEEARAIIALDKITGKQMWKAEGTATELAYGTPAIVPIDKDRSDLVLGLPGEVWGLNPESGKLRWFATHSLTGNVCPSVIHEAGRIFLFGGFRSAGSLALRAGGEGDVTKTHVIWTSRNSSYVATPALYGGHFYWINDSGQAFCMSAENGENVYRQRVEEIQSGGRPVYASPIICNGKIYVQTRWDGVVILDASPTYRVLAHNRMESDSSGFNATPAFSDNQIFLRSNTYLYCVSKEVD